MSFSFSSERLMELIVYSESQMGDSHTSVSLFLLSLFSLAKTGTCLVVRVILQTARASVFHVNHPGVYWNGVLHQPLLQERVNRVQSRQPT